jgi:ABC-type multidrug transport system fused ATPase/permease subunit
MVGIRKAPLLHHFSETVSGAATIRCFNQGEKFFTKTLALIDDYTRITFHNSATVEWLCIRINFLFNLVFFVMLVILVSLPRIQLIQVSLVQKKYLLTPKNSSLGKNGRICSYRNSTLSVQNCMNFSFVLSQIF